MFIKLKLIIEGKPISHLVNSDKIETFNVKEGKFFLEWEEVDEDGAHYATEVADSIDIVVERLKKAGLYKD